MRIEEDEDAPNAVTVIFSIRAHPIDVLIDFDTTHAFISAMLVKTLRLVPISKHSIIFMALLNGKIMRCDELYTNYATQIDCHVFLVDLHKLSFE